MSSDPDACVPKAVTDFVFDLYDSVTTSQIAEEQSKLYGIDFHELNAKYFGGSSGAAASSASSSNASAVPWPSPQAIAGECNGDPLFLALYRELTHRQFHAVSRPTIRDRCEGWHLYRELFEEILELESFYIVPSWCFDILHEFVYQFQGFCQVRSAVYASAKKHGLLSGDESTAAPTTSEGGGGGGGSNAPSSTLLENLSTLQSTDAWEAEAVFGYLNKLVHMASPSALSSQQQEGSSGSSKKPVVYTYLSLFASVALSRLECLLGDYTACLRAVQGPLTDHAAVVVDGDKTAKDVVHGVLSARLSVAYHSGVSYLMLRRYKDAISTLADMCAGFPHLVAAATAAVGGSGSGAVVAMNARKHHHHHHHHHRDNKQDNSAAAQLQAQLMKQYDRMVSLLVVLTQLTPNALLTISDDATRRAIRDKLAKDPSGGTSLEEFFASPKFIAVHTPSSSVIPFHRHQTNLFLKEAQLQTPYKTLRSYLKLYKSLPLPKLATFYDKSVEEVLPLLLSYKTKMRQLETSSHADPAADTAGVDSSAASSSYKTAMDIHYYVVDSMCHIDEPERQRRFETHFFRQIAHAAGIARQAAAIDVRL